MVRSVTTSLIYTDASRLHQAYKLIVVILLFILRLYNLLLFLTDIYMYIYIQSLISFTRIINKISL